MLVDEYGSEWEVARRLDVSQSTVNRAIHGRSAGPVLLMNALKMLKMDEREFVRKYAPEAEMQIRLEPDMAVRMLSRERKWLPTTTLQLEVLRQKYPSASRDDLAHYGALYDAINAHADKQLRGGG